MAHGLPCALYTDRATTISLRPRRARRSPRSSRPRSAARAQLGIEPIPACAPEARGRAERAFGTLQDRLPKERARRHHHARGGQPLPRGGRSARANARFAVAPEQPETAFVADQAGAHRDILCVQEERVVGNDNGVRYHGLALPIPPIPLRAHFVKAKERVHGDPGGTLALFHGPRRLARCRADGTRLGADPMLAV